MNRYETWAFNALMAVVTLTGLVYVWMKYVLRTDDPFALINHPWQPGMLAGHIVVAPMAMLVFGMLFRSHILEKLVSNRKPARRSGWTSLISFGGMALSGYGLQVAGDPETIRVFFWLHIVTSIVFVAGYSAHLVIGWRLPEKVSRLRRRPDVVASGSSS